MLHPICHTCRSFNKSFPIIANLLFFMKNTMMNRGIQFGKIEWRVGRTKRTRRKRVQQRPKKRLKFHLRSRWKRISSEYMAAMPTGIKLVLIPVFLCSHYLLFYGNLTCYEFIIKHVLYYLDSCLLCRSPEAAQPLSTVIPVPKSKLGPYRTVIIMRLVILGLFFHYRVTHPVDSAYGLWLTSVICEIWFAFSWVLDQFPKWSPIDRVTYIDRLSARYTSLECKTFTHCFQ